MRERKNGVIEWTMRHYQITLLVITVLVGLGILGLVDGVSGVHHPPRRGSGGLPRGDFRRGGGAVGQAFGEIPVYLQGGKEEKDVLHVKGWNGVRNGGAERRREQ